MNSVKRPNAKSRFYGFPIARVGVIYGLAQLVASLVIMLLGKMVAWWIALLLYSLGLGLALIGMISMQSVVEQIQAQDVRQKQNTATMRSLQSKLGQVAAQTDNAQVKALAEEFRFSDPVSNYSVAETEVELTRLVDALQAAVEDGDDAVLAQLCSKASALLAERNRLCKLNKY